MCFGWSGGDNKKEICSGKNAHGEEAEETSVSYFIGFGWMKDTLIKSRAETKDLSGIGVKKTHYFGRRERRTLE